MTPAYRPVRQRDPSRRRPRRTAPPAVFSGTLFRLRPRIEWMEDRTLLSTFVVSSTADSGPGSLRQAILDSNAATGATNTIDFAVAGSGVQTIDPLSPLPAIVKPVLIDGRSQPGYSGTPLIEIDGGQAVGGDGLLITGADVTIRGLDVDGFSQGAGIHITSSGATGDWVYACFLGTDPSGTKAEPDQEGVEIDGGASSNLIGTNGDGVDDATERNLLSGNTFAGVEINGTGTDQNAIAGNLIGTTLTGETALDNGTSPAAVDVLTIGGGVVIEGGASGNRIGTDGTSVDDAGERNVIAGSDNDGIDIIDSGTDDNVVAGNLIGTDATGKTALRIADDGVLIAIDAMSNTVGAGGVAGGVAADEGNVISGNGGDGVQIADQANSNVVTGDDIGTDATARLPLGNAKAGIEIDGSLSNEIGGTDPGDADVISDNGDWGVTINGANENVVEGDFIGTDSTGTLELGNARGGVDFSQGASYNTLGGTAADAGDLITDNSGPGVVVTGDQADNDQSNGDQITADRIFGNAGQAIDLGDDGVSPNRSFNQGGPNDWQNSPLMVVTAGGEIQGWLGESEPQQTYRIDVYASAGYGPGDSGEAQDYLGSVQATTDEGGQVLFTTPFTPPAGMPVITATASVSWIGTSELTSFRQGAAEVPPQPIRLAPGQMVSFTSSADRPIALEDPWAGPFAFTWDLTLSAPVGTLTLATTAGLIGSGDGTGVLSYSGSIADLDAALDGLTWAAPPDYEGKPTLILEAMSGDAFPVAAQIPLVVTTGRFEVTTTADTGPGSLRQSILDSNDAPGGTNTIDFDIPGTGIRTIAPASPLPAIATPVVIDGTSQPGYAGTPLVAVVGQGSEDADALSAGVDLTVKGLLIGGCDLSAGSTSTTVSLESIPFPGAPAATIDYPFDVTEGQDLTVTVAATGTTASLSLLDSRGQLVMRGEDPTVAASVAALDTYVASGTYTLQVQDGAGGGSFTLTVIARPSDEPRQLIPVGNDPTAITSGDFSGNGILDLAVTNLADNTVSVLMGNGDGTFQPAVVYPVGPTPDAIVAGDFAGDGILDLAVTNSGSDTVSILMGNGDGTFRPAVAVPVGGGPDAIVAGDFNGDGKLDLAVANGNDNDVSILLGHGDGTFEPQVTYATGNVPDAITAGDFDRDGKLDLAVANYFDNTVSVLMGNGDGSFRPQVVYPVGETTFASPCAVVAADFSGNGVLDLAVSNQQEFTVSILMGNGDGTFQPDVNYPTGGEPGGIAVGDFNDDGKFDLAIAESGSSNVSIMVGDGDGTFQKPENLVVAGALFSVGVAAGDFNGDGKLDLAVTNTTSNNVAILLGDGGGHFPAPLLTQIGTVLAMAAGDFNGDGRLDLAIAGGSGSEITILLGNGDGTFIPGQTSSLRGNITALVTGDFNGDGRLDLAAVTTGFAGSDDLWILLGNGDGTFQAPVTYSFDQPPPSEGFIPGGLPAAIVAGDFAGDGILDLAVTTVVGDRVSVFLGNGDGTFRPPVAYTVGYQPDGIVAADLSGNGILDLAVYDTWSNEVSILMGNGDGTFQPAVNDVLGPGDPGVPGSGIAGFTNEGLVAGDLSGNGIVDLAVDDAFAGGVSILMGNGDGTFRPPVTYPVTNAGLALGDFNGDGKLDLVLGGGINDDMQFLEGNGDGTFQPAVGVPAGVVVSNLLVGDFNGDGKPDVAVAGSGLLGDGTTAATVLLNDGDGRYSLPGEADTTAAANPIVADVNGDGTDDVLVVDGDGDILYRQGLPGQPGLWEPPIIVNPGRPSRDIAWVPDSLDGPLLASVDARDDAVSLYAYRGGAFVQVGSLATGPLPAQIIAADFTGTGWDDLVVRNAGDGTLSFFRDNGLGSIATGFSSPFLPSVTIAVGLGASDVQALDVSGDGHLDLVVTNELTGQVSVLHNRGDATFDPPVPYQAGTSLPVIDPDGNTEVSSLDATIGVAAGSLVPGGPPDLVTVNATTDTLDVLAGLGGGRLGQPVTFQSQSTARIIRMADFTGDGIPDLAVLTATGLEIYLGDGRGEFLPPTTYAVPPDSDGLTVADLLGDGKLDLLVGDAYGDVLVLLGNGDGTFQPYHEATQTIELAVADLTGDGQKDIIYADQGLDRVVVDYGAGNSDVLADQSTGLLEPGAVALADLNGDGIPDLIVANSGSNNVLIYPGLGNGQFGPAINDGNGYFVGTNPVGITVAYLTGALPDLVVADEGSDQVSILLNQSQPGGAIAFAAGPRLNSGGSGPVSTVVENVSGGPYPDLLVTNSLSNDVTLLPGVGQGFFDDQDPRIYSVGADPTASFVGNFGGQPELVTVNAGSNDVTVIADFAGADPAVSLYTSGGVDPTTAFAFEQSDGFEDLVVGNTADGVLALFVGGPQGLSLTSIGSEPNLPDPTALSFSALTTGAVQFYAATAGRESADLVALGLATETGSETGGGTGTETGSGSATSTASGQPAGTATGPAASSPTSSVSATETGTGAVSPSSAVSVQLIALHDTSLPLAATVLTLTVSNSSEETGPSFAEEEGLATVATTAGPGTSAGQGPFATPRGSGASSDPAEDGDESGAATAAAAVLAPWEQFVLGLDKALEELERENAGGMMAPPEPTDRSEPPPSPGVPAQGGPPIGTDDPSSTSADASDATVARLGSDRTRYGSAEIDPAMPWPGADEPGLAPMCVAVPLLAAQLRGLRRRSWRPEIRRMALAGRVPTRTTATAAGGR